MSEATLNPLECALDEVQALRRQADELLAENARLREELTDAPKCEACEAMLDCDECLRADGSHKERRRLSSENAKLREYATKLEQANIVLSSDNCDLLNDMQDMQFFIDENRKLRKLAQRADRLLTELFSHIDYSRCTALEAVAAWRVRARELRVEVDK